MISADNVQRNISRYLLQKNWFDYQVRLILNYAIDIWVFITLGIFLIHNASFGDCARHFQWLYIDRVTCPIHNKYVWSSIHKSDSQFFVYGNCLFSLQKRLYLPHYIFMFQRDRCESVIPFFLRGSHKKLTTVPLK